MVRRVRNILKRKKQFAHMTIGSLYKALDRHRDVLPVRFDVGGYPGMPHQYRGNKEHIAFSPMDEEMTVAEVKEMCQDCMKMAYQDENNNTIEIKSNALVWASTIERVTNLAIVDVVPNDGAIILVLDTPRTV